MCDYKNKTHSTCPTRGLRGSTLNLSFNVLTTLSCVLGQSNREAIKIGECCWTTDLHEQFQELGK